MEGLAARACEHCGGSGLSVSPEDEELACHACWGTGSDAADMLVPSALSAFVVRFLNEHLATVRQIGADYGDTARELLMRLYERNRHSFIQAVTAIERGRAEQVVLTLEAWGRERDLA